MLGRLRAALADVNQAAEWLWAANSVRARFELTGTVTSVQAAELGLVGEIFTAARPPAAETLAVALVEGWRGEICHVAITDAAGRFRRYKITDPSFHNWPGLALAMRDQAISDFPICNKSFNLSYCGFDL